MTEEDNLMEYTKKWNVKVDEILPAPMCPYYLYDPSGYCNKNKKICSEENCPIKDDTLPFAYNKIFGD